MNDSEFITLADQALKRIELALEASDADLDYSMTGSGVLEIEFDDGHWEVDAYQNGVKIEVNVDPTTGAITADK